MQVLKAGRPGPVGARNVMQAWICVPAPLGGVRVGPAQQGAPKPGQAPVDTLDVASLAVDGAGARAVAEQSTAEVIFAEPAPT
jgi:hypothetical protein